MAITSVNCHVRAQVSKENGSDYSESIADCSYCKKITGTLIVQNLIEEDFGGDIRICLSQEMENWLQTKNINFEKSIKILHLK